MKRRIVGPPSDPTFRYAILGVAAGVIFPLAATVAQMGLSGLDVSLAALIEAQRGQPLLWIIDTSPLVLGTLAAVLGRHQSVIRKLREEHRAADVDRFFQLSLDPLCMVGMDGRFRRVNPSFTRVLGHEAEDLAALRFLDLVHPGDRAHAMTQTRRLEAGQSVPYFEVRCRHADGTDGAASRRPARTWSMRWAAT